LKIQIIQKSLGTRKPKA